MSKERPPLVTYWSAMVEYNDNHSGASAAGATFAEFIAELVRTCHYYMVLYPNAEMRIKWIREMCKHCDGTGKVQRSRLRQVKCPVCRGTQAGGSRSGGHAEHRASLI